MKLIIEIDEEIYDKIANDNEYSFVTLKMEQLKRLDDAIRNGTPLPNGKSILVIDTPKTCGDCPCCIFTAEEKRAIGFCNTSNEDYYCKLLESFREYDEVDGGVDILGKPSCCPLGVDKEGNGDE